MKSWLENPASEAPCSVVAEIAQAHDGSLGAALAMIDAAAEAGVDAVKFQTHIASEESSADEPWRTKFSPQDETRYAYWQRMEFTEPQWAALRERVNDRGLLFLSSPFSMQAFRLLERVGVAAWKVASGEITNFEMLDAMCATGRPLLLSTGMSPVEEIDISVKRIQASGAPLAVLQCASIYPTSPEHVGLNVLEEFRGRYGAAVGLSDHSATIFPGVCAAYLGAQVIEVHLTLSRRSFGPDVPASLTVEEMAELVRGVRFAEGMREHVVHKQGVDPASEPLRRIFMRSLVAARDMQAGETLDAGALTSRKPGTGIPVSRYDEFLGRRLARPVARHQLLTEADFES
jgi:N,N'-diacetyllegionaminate synthase